MPASKLLSRIRSLFLWALALAILIVIFRRVPFSQLAQAWSRFHLLGFAGPLVAFFLVLFFLDSYAHAWLLRRFGAPLPYPEVLRARGASYLLASVGFLYGQGSIAYILSKKTGRSLSEIAGIIFFLAYNTYHSLLILPTLLLFSFFHDPGFGQTREFHWLLLFMAVAWPLFALSLLFWVRGRPQSLRRRLHTPLLAAFDQARLSDYAFVIALRLVQNLIWIALTAVALRSLDLRLPLADLILKLPLISFVAAIPTPGRLGTTQGAWLVLFAGQAPAQDLLLFSLAWTLAMNLLRWIFGLLFLRHFSSAPSTSANT
ncbi:MAG: hypothetical protein A2V67_01120 [Deltaproteobacteria bacterium RBG_13_61_14]|nr:MAG: hypothetical protein A2V67_01120 [Deltaproteobacteria bacterium RBG_13_61_14]